jgi:HD-GYP domain-containing protein (c-di-GMP phosphodiesterase class II)
MNTKVAALEIQKIPTSKLELGMYVSKLDRPWLETPFLFQGFHIESEDVIAELRKHCKHVYVDVTRYDEAYAARREHAAAAAANGRRLAAGGGGAAGATPRSDDAHRETIVLRDELVNAKEAYSAVEDFVENLHHSVGSGNEIDVTSVQRALRPMIDSIMRNEDALSWLVRMKRKDNYIYSHSIGSAIWALVFGKHLGLEQPELQVLSMGTIFMDVGKTKIPTELLTRKGPLSSDEMKQVRMHVPHGVAIVSKISGVDPRVIEMVQCHHERHNGTGYPCGLAGSAIPIFARIAGVVDAYDAMTAIRPYAEARSPYDATRQLSKLAGVDFAAELIEQFVQAIGVFPVGTLVELNTGEVGMVIAQNRVRRLRPKIILLLDRDKKPLESFTTLDLRNQLADNSGQQSLWIERGLAPGEYGLDPTEYYLTNP